MNKKHSYIIPDTSAQSYFEIIQNIWLPTQYSNNSFYIKSIKSLDVNVKLIEHSSYYKIDKQVQYIIKLEKRFQYYM